MTSISCIGLLHALVRVRVTMTMSMILILTALILQSGIPLAAGAALSSYSVSCSGTTPLGSSTQQVFTSAATGQDLFSLITNTSACTLNAFLDGGGAPVSVADTTFAVSVLGAAGRGSSGL